MHNPIPQLQRAPLPGPVTWYEPARPPCRKTWFGTLRCNFEARYDFEFDGMNVNVAGDAFVSRTGKNKTRKRYVHDICTACSRIVKRERDAP